MSTTSFTTCCFLLTGLFNWTPARNGRQFWPIAFSALILMLATTPPTHAQENFPLSIDLSGQTLVKQGQGTRKKAFISLYKAGLYLKSNTADPATIIAADEAMAIRLNIVSGFISSEKMNTAMRDGFDKSTGGNPAPIQAEIDLFASGFNDEINKKDIFDLVYTPSGGVEVIKNGTGKVTIPGLPFKQALFGIWLSENPVQKSLKNSLLGAK